MQKMKSIFLLHGNCNNEEEEPCKRPILERHSANILSSIKVKGGMVCNKLVLPFAMLKCAVQIRTIALMK